MSNKITITKITILTLLLSVISAFGWQPSGWVYRTGSYTYSIADSDWYFDAPGWQHRVVDMTTYVLEDSPNQGWNYYLWPYAYSFSEGRWFLTTEPGDAAWTVSLSSGIWSIFGDVSGATLSGQVLNFDDGTPVEGATISLQDLTGNSNASGGFSIPGITEAERVVATITKDGFAPQSVILSLDGEDTTETFLIVPASAVEIFDPTLAQILDVENSPAQVSLGSNALVTGTGGAPTGQVQSTITVLDPGTDPDAMPGDFSVMGNDGLLESFGAISVEFQDADGNDLDLASGSSATIRIPVASGSTNPPTSIPLWYYDEEQGLWVEEGTATLSQDGTYYSGTVEHFSTWNADSLYDRAFIEGCVVDSENNPVPGARVKTEGIDYNGTATTYTDSNGEFRIAAKDDSLVIVSATRSGVSTNTRSVFTGAANSTSTLEECLMLGSTDSTATIKLTWGENPSDLDSHLTGPTAGGGTFEVYFGNKGSLSISPFANLDVDDTTSYGPEIITINQFVNGTYTYFVDHWSGSSNISNSGARVELNIDGNVTIYTPPAGITSSTQDWYVFELVVSGGSITVNSL